MKTGKNKLAKADKQYIAVCCTNLSVCIQLIKKGAVLWNLKNLITSTF